MELSTHYTRTGRSKPTTGPELELAQYWKIAGGAGNNERQRMPKLFPAPQILDYTTPFR